MPVATRRSQAGGVTRKAPARKVRTTRSTTNRQNSSNWENDGDGDGDGDGDDDGDGDGDGDDDGDDNDADGQDNPIDSGARALSIFGGTKGHGHGQSSNVDDAVEPLLPREVVDQIDNEVEEFAENLDKFLDQLRESGRRPYHLALELVNKFKVIAHDSARKLDDDYRKERLRQSLRQKQPLVASTSLKLAGSQSRARPDKIALRRQRQQEADVWDLFRIMLEVHHNPDTPSPQQRREDIAAMGPVNHYTTEQELWKRFLLVNDSARERNLVKGWLEQTADHQAGTVGDIMEELEAEYGRSNGLWSHGWMDSREQIKNEKRMRAWPAPDADPLPHLRTKDKTELLVTSLDPDAATRQERVLERSDMEFERAIWTVCWEMLRRGKTWQEVSQWCQEHHEGWRAIVLGQGCDPSQVRSNIRLRRMAFLASQYELSSDHEAAVYGLLGGNTKAVQKVCRSMDDHLYAHYCATLLRQFEQFLAAEVPIRAPKSSLPDENLQDPERAIFDLLEKLRKEPDTKEESIMPMKIIESYVIANDVASMVHTLGHALSVTDQQSGREEKMIAHIEPFWDEKEKNQPEESIGLDPHALRIATHMSIILDIVAPQNLQGDEVIAKSNVTSAYVQALRAAGKRDLIPVYASRLTPGAYVMAMSQVFEDITAPKEQDQTLKLLRSYKLDVTWVLNEHVGHVLSKRLSDIPRSQKPVNILEASDNPKHPGQQIVNGFLDDGHPEQDTHILASLKWYDIVEGLWKDTFFSLSLSLRKALLAGRLGLACKIVMTYPYDQVALRKSYQEVGRSYNPMDADQAAFADDTAQLGSLRKQSRTYYELSQLVEAIQCLFIWRTQEAEYLEKHPRLSGASPDLKNAKEAVTDAMEPILTRSLLLGDDYASTDEKSDCARIREWYIPELIIAYNTVLHSAGHLISRDNLIDSMDLSVLIADDQNHLSEVFVQARRMREIVASFAATSKAMLRLKAEGKKWTSRKQKGREGKDLGIWEIAPQQNESRLARRGQTVALS